MRRPCASRWPIRPKDWASSCLSDSSSDAETDMKTSIVYRLSITIFTLAGIAAALNSSPSAATRKFYDDDPIWIERDTQDASRIRPWKLDGVSPGFTITDSARELWFLKFDPLGYRGMGTGSEMVSTKLLWALGYHVPESHIAYLHPEQLVIGEGAKYEPPGGKKRPMQ